jgi:CRP-like cAMP-binding protein/RsiW-degrading membrane proteinase PrsW (M82 family)
MMWQKIALALIPVPAFYLIYYRYFTFKPEIVKHIEAFFSGIGLALIIILLSPLFKFISTTDPFFLGFVQAGLVEKIGAFCILLLLQMYYPNFSIMESILSSMVFGIGFSAIENVSYALNFGFSIIVVRILFSVPLHLTTCGIMGYFLGMRKMSENWINRISYTALALIVPVLLHGTFDTTILHGGYLSYLASPMLIGLVITLEVLMARAQTILPLQVIRALTLRFEDWTIIVRQPSYERWILQSMGTPDRAPEPFFQWRPGLVRFFFVVVFMLGALLGLIYKSEITSLLGAQLGNEDQVILLGIFPFSLSMILILVGAINPNFFKNSKIKIPIISDVEVTSGDEFEEVLVTYDITVSSCFLRTAEPYGIGVKKTIRFECPNFASEQMEGVIVWENHSNPHAPRGSVMRLQAPHGFFFRFLVRYNLFRIFKGIVFNLKLPGFESIRKLFMRPISTMQDIRIMEAGKVIYQQGDRALEFYLLKKGRIILYKTKENGEIITIDTIEDEQLFGEMAVIGSSVRNETARCVTDCVIAVADRENLNALVRNNTEFALNLLESLAKRVQISEKILFENIHELEKKKTSQARKTRAAIILLLLGTGFKPEGKKLEIPVDVKKISEALADVDLESVVAAFKTLMKKGKSGPETVDPGDDEGTDRLIERLRDQFTITFRLDRK